MKGRIDMNKTKSKEQIYQEIIQEMPPNLNEKELATFIMKKIAQERSFSSRYYWTDTMTREKIYESCIMKLGIDNVKLSIPKSLICPIRTIYVILTSNLIRSMHRKYRNTTVYYINAFIS